MAVPFTGMVPEAVGAQKSPSFNTESEKVQSEDVLLQFKSGGHILGFKPDRVYVVGLGYALIEEFVGARGVMPLSEEGSQRGSKQQESSPTIKKVIYPDLWRGISVIYEAGGRGLAESTFVIQPGADVDRIRLRHNAGMEMQKDGSLRFSSPTHSGYFARSAPMGWQEKDGTRVPVEVAFEEYAENIIGFRVGEYDRHYSLNIAPTYEWHTFYGPGAGNIGNAITTDGSGNVYVTGTSFGTWQGDGATNPLHPFTGESDIVVLKLNSSGQYQWHTFYGSDEYGYGIAIDGSGNVYVTGDSEETWQGDDEVNPLHPYSGGTDYLRELMPSQLTGTQSNKRIKQTAAATPGITVLSPNGGETWQAGTIQKIHYTNGTSQVWVGSMRIDLLKGGTFKKKISSDIATVISHGYWTWQIPSNQAPGNDYRIRIKVHLINSGHRFEDTSDGNFTIVGPANGGKPDLVVTDLAFSVNPVPAGNLSRITFYVKNQGTEKARGHKNTLYIDGKPIKSWSCTGLFPGETKTWHWDYKRIQATPNPHLIAVKADSSNKVPESNEINNELTRNLNMR